MSKELITKKDADSILDQRKALAKWLTMAHQNPEKVVGLKGVKYVPISFVEMKLDELFMDGWNLEIKSYEVILNAFVVTVRISGLNPATGREFFRDGIGAKDIQLKSGSKSVDSSTIQFNSCGKGFPSAKSTAVKNAAQSIGKVFGRDISRELEDQFDSIIEIIDQEDIDYFIQRIDQCNTKEEIQVLMARLKKELELIPDIFSQVRTYASGRYSKLKGEENAN